MKLRLFWLLLTVIVVFALATLLGMFHSSSVSPEAKQPLTAEQQQALIPKGRELALAGNCMGCHSKAQGPMGAGGLPIDTPFGTIYSSNITPDKQHGIGHYSREDFHRALRDGIAPGNKNLYPAMPFVFTHITQPDDLDALYAYIMSVPAIAEANTPNTGVCVLPVRAFMNFWTLINFPKRQPPEHPDASDAWLRGGYLVEGLSHCGACHTPRNITMGVNFAKTLQGGDDIDGLIVPNITAETLASRGFNQESLSQYLASGVSEQGTAFGSMYTVTHFSTSQMQPSDVAAMATYLMTDNNGKLLSPASHAKINNPQADQDFAAGRLTYMSACAGCHGDQGEGIANVAPAMDTNITVVMENPTNLLQIIAHGVPTQTFSGNQRMYAMPGFHDQLSAQDIAQLASWMRVKWGNQGPITAEQVEKVLAP